MSRHGGDGLHVDCAAVPHIWEPSLRVVTRLGAVNADTAGAGGVVVDRHDMVGDFRAAAAAPVRPRRSSTSSVRGYTTACNYSGFPRGSSSRGTSDGCRLPARQRLGCRGEGGGVLTARLLEPAPLQLVDEDTLRNLPKVRFLEGTRPSTTDR